VAGCCEYGDEPAGSGATKLVSGRLRHCKYTDGSNTGVQQYCSVHMNI
jgi:hypothetical protein